MANRRPLVLVGGVRKELPNGDTLSISALATGTPDGTKFVRDDGTLAVPGGGGSGLTWATVTANTTMAAGNAYIAVGALDMTLPVSTATGDYFIVHAQSATVRIVSNGNVITGVGSGNDLTLATGETAWLVARSSGNLEIV